MKTSFALSNLLLLSSAASFAASFAFQNAGLEQRSSVVLGARKKAASSEEDEREAGRAGEDHPADGPALVAQERAGGWGFGFYLFPLYTRAVLLRPTSAVPVP